MNATPLTLLAPAHGPRGKMENRSIYPPDNQWVVLHFSRPQPTPVFESKIELKIEELNKCSECLTLTQGNWQLY